MNDQHARVHTMANVQRGRLDLVELIPWDITDEKHVQRLQEQRVACGWRAEEVPRWRDIVAQGFMSFHWIVSTKIRSSRAQP